MALAVATSAAAKTLPLPKSVSTSRQFIVYGSDARLRGGICDSAERTKAAVLLLLQQRDDWKTPILVHAEMRAADLPETPVARLNFSQTGFGLKLQLDLTIGSDVSAPAIQRQLLAAILLERMYRDAPDIAAGTPYVQPPGWLLDGLLGASAEQSDPAAAAVAQNNVINLADFLNQQPDLLEPPSRAVYRAYAGAFVSMLIELPDGRARLAKLISDLSSAGREPIANLEAHFPETAGKPDVLQARWANAVTRYAAKDRYRMLSCEETESGLAALLVVQLPAGKAANAYALEQFPRFIKSPASAVALRKLGEALLVFSARANPVYAPVIAEYEQVTARLARRKTGNITERLARVRTAREEISRRMSAIGDYINWFEATQARTPSGAFADYMKAAELSAERETRRHDAVSVYLDTVEAQLSP